MTAAYARMVFLMLEAMEAHLGRDGFDAALAVAPGAPSRAIALFLVAR